MNSIYTLPFFLILILFSSCTEPVYEISDSNQDELFKIWKLKSIDFDGFETKDNHLSYNRKVIKYNGFIIALFPDQTGTLIQGVECDTFRWEMDAINNKLVIDSGPNITAFDEMTFLKNKQGLFMLINYEKSGILKMAVHGNITADYKEDPFHSLNNKWRMHAVRMETPQELKGRAINYLQHYRYLFKSRMDDPERKFSSVNSKGIVHVSHGGISPVGDSKIKEEWINYFFIEEQAYDTYYEVEEMIENKSLKTQVGDDWIENNYNYLTELLKKYN